MLSDSIARLSKKTAKQTVRRLCIADKERRIKLVKSTYCSFGRYLTYAKRSWLVPCGRMYGFAARFPYTFFMQSGSELHRIQVDLTSRESLQLLGSSLIFFVPGIINGIVLRNLFYMAILDEQTVPVVVDLRQLPDYFEDGRVLVDLVYDSFQKYHAKMKKELFYESLEAGCYLFLFYGIDRLERKSANSVMGNIVSLKKHYPENAFFLLKKPTVSYRAFGITGF